MDDQIMTSVLLGLSAVTILVIGLQFIWEYIYDLGQIRSQKQSAALNSKSPPPPITIIMQTHNDKTRVEASLNSILRSSYKHYRIVVIDNASQDSTVAVLRQMAKKNPKQITRIVAKRKHQTLKLADLLRDYSKGELSLILSTPHRLDKQALAHTAQEFIANPSLKLLNLWTTKSSPNWLMSIAQKYWSISDNRNRKIQSHKTIIGSSFAISRHPNKTANHKQIDYSSSVRALSLRQPTAFERIKMPKDLQHQAGQVAIRNPLNYQSILITAALPALFCSFILVFIVTGSGVFFVFGWGIYTISTIISIVGDKDLTVAQKLGYLKHIIPAYIIYCGYFMSTIVQRLSNITKQGTGATKTC